MEKEAKRRQDRGYIDPIAEDVNSDAARKAQMEKDRIAASEVPASHLLCESATKRSQENNSQESELYITIFQCTRSGCGYTECYRSLRLVADQVDDAKHAEARRKDERLKQRKADREAKVLRDQSLSEWERKYLWRTDDSKGTDWIKKCDDLKMHDYRNGYKFLLPLGKK